RQDRFAAGQPVQHPQRRVDTTDAATQLPHVRLAEPLAENLDRSRARMALGGKERKRGRLAGAVRPEHDPVLAGPDGPVNFGQDALLLRRPDRRPLYLNNWFSTGHSSFSIASTIRGAPGPVHFRYLIVSRNSCIRPPNWLYPGRFCRITIADFSMMNTSGWV